MQILNIKEPNAISEGLSVLKKGGIIIYPTETAYGVGVDATNSNAVYKLLNYKKRPQGKAISIGVIDQSMASLYVELNKTAINIYKEFLPGPVTVISKSKNIVDKRLESENGTLGIRIPDSKFILNLIKEFKKPITTTSANSSGKKTPYNINDIFENLTKKQLSLIDLVIDGGQLPKRLTSTVIDTTTDDIKTYRHGSINPLNTKPSESYLSRSFEETIDIGFNLAEKLKSNFSEKSIVFLLRGELGAGKTHLTKGVAKSFGITQTVKSPTYSYLNEYILPNSHKFFHLDAWKFDNENDVKSVKINSLLTKQNILVIEWPEILINLGFKFDELFNSTILDIKIKVNSDNSRSILVY